MPRRIRDLLAQRATEGFVGRTQELALLLQCLEEEGPLLVFVHGIGGIGKSSLLDAFAAEARAHGTTVVRLDCRAIEPTERGFLHALGAAIGDDAATPEEAAERLGHLGDPIVLALDTYEVFRLMDTWLRQAFVPALTDNVRMLFFGREAPVAAWLTAPGWQGLFRSVLLDPLSEADAADLLVRAGVREEDAPRINRFAHGHPLALKLAAAALRERPALRLEEAVVQRVVDELTRMYLADVRDPLTREVLEAASVVRRTTHSLLGAMIPHTAPQDIYDRLDALPFVETTPDGLHIHDTVQEAIAAGFRATDPTRYRDFRRAAWRQLRTEVRTAGRPELWRYTADLLYIIENPVIREAFFPSGAQQVTVEPARPEDDEAIRAIAQGHEGPKGAQLLITWWKRVPQAFSVVRDREGAVVGYYCMFDPSTVNRSFFNDDPIVRSYWAHVQEDPMSKGQRALFIRRWLGPNGELPSPAQAACWLDMKRAYMQMRPHLRRVYGTLNDMATYGATFQKLGFKPLLKSEIELDGRTYWVALLDMGPSSVDGWLAGLVAAELGVEEGDLLDLEARELLVDGKRIGLTKLEFAVMQYLREREGKAVSRTSLLSDVWGYDYEGGSNVVDVVIQSLRKKLGGRASIIETVTGVGYRFRPYTW